MTDVLDFGLISFEKLPDGGVEVGVQQGDGFPVYYITLRTEDVARLLQWMKS